MTTKADVAQANMNVDEARAALTAFWEKALDESGNFEWVFGDPKATVCTFRAFTQMTKCI